MKPYILLIGIAGLFFFPFLGGAHLFDWDEINFAEIAREMIVSGEYLRPTIDFMPFWEKPPLFIWMQVASMKIFGVNEFAARFPNAVIGLLSLILLFRIGTKLYNQRFGLYWAMAYVGSILPHLYFKSGIIDPTFNFFIYLSYYFVIKSYWKQHSKTSKGSAWNTLAISVVFMGLAILTKGQVALLLIGICLIVYWIKNRFKFYLPFYFFIIFGMGSLAVAGIWFGIESIRNGTWFVQEFITYQIRLLKEHDAGHQGFFGYHFIVLFIGCFPASAFFFSGIRKVSTENFNQNDFRVWMKYLFFTVLIVFSLVQTKIVHYSSLAYFPITYFAARGIYLMEERVINYTKWHNILILIPGSLFFIVLLVLPLVMGTNLIEKIIPLIDDPFAVGNIRADVNWPIYILVVPSILLSVLIVYLTKVKQNFTYGIRILFAGNALVIALAILFYVGRIEGHSQRAAISFFKSKVGENAYVQVLGYKSYAHLFYTKKAAPPNPTAEQLLYEPLQRTAYFVCKIQHKQQYIQLPGIKLLYEKNGFVFLERVK